MPFDEKMKLQALYALLAVFILLHILPLTTVDTLLWGIDQFRYIPLVAVVAAIVLAVLISLPKPGNDVLTAIGRVFPEGGKTGAKRGSFVFWTVLLVCAAAIFWLARSRTYFLGDGYLWASHLKDRDVLNEPVLSWLYLGILDLGRKAGIASATPVSVSSIVSVISGIIFLVYSVKIAITLCEDHARRMFIVLAILSCGTMMLFFGYVEAYPPLVAVLMIYFYYGIRVLQGRSHVMTAAAVFLAAVLLHMSAIALLPSLLIILWINKGRKVERKKYYALTAGVVATGLVILAVLQRAGPFSTFFYETFLPFFSTAGRNRVAYPLFSFESLFDLGNEIILICPIAFFIVAGFRRGMKDREKDGEDRSDGNPVDASTGVKIFLETAVIFYVIEFLVFNTNIGVSRDWDLFSPMAIPLALLTSIILIERFPAKSGMLSSLAVLVMLVHTGPWIALNAGTDSSKARFIHLAENGFWSGHAKGYGYSTLSKYHDALGDRTVAVMYSKLASKGDPGNPRYLYDTAELYDKLGQYSEAAEMYRKVIEKRPEDIVAINNLGVDYLHLGRLDLAGNVFLKAQSIDSTNLSSFKNLAYVYFTTYSLESYLELYDKSRIDPERKAYLRGLVMMHGEQAPPEKIEHLLREMSLVDPGDADMGLAYAHFLHNAGRREEVATHLILMLENGCSDRRIPELLELLRSPASSDPER
jgi:tetratricopeptide (TPR) repeat protein